MNAALKPSAKHFLQYDAATFESEGFKTLNGRISLPAIEPRWSVSVKVITENFEGTEKIKDHFNFKKLPSVAKLSDLRDQVKKEVLDKDDYLPVCTMFSKSRG